MSYNFELPVGNNARLCKVVFEQLMTLVLVYRMCSTPRGAMCDISLESS